MTYANDQVFDGTRVITPYAVVLVGPKFRAWLTAENAGGNYHSDRLIDAVNLMAEAEWLSGGTLEATP